MKLSTGWRGKGISWNFPGCDGTSSYERNQKYTKVCDIIPGKHTLTCKNDDGFGWNGAFIEIEGREYCNDFNSGYEKKIEIFIIGTILANDFIR